MREVCEKRDIVKIQGPGEGGSALNQEQSLN